MIWNEFTLSELATDFINGGTPSTKVPAYWDGDIPWITGADVDDRAVSTARKHITKEAVLNSSTHVVPKNALLLVTRTGVGKIAKADYDIAISQDLTGIVLRKGVDPDYAVYAIQSKMKSLARFQQGAIIKGLLRKDVENLVIPLPALSEQRRIVEILDQADALRKKRAEADKIAERIFPALFYKMFGDPVKNDKRFTRERLGSLMKVKSGESVPVKKLHPTGGFPVYGGNGINGYHTDYMLDGPVVVIGRVGQYCGSVYYSRQRCWVTDNALFVCECDRRLHPRYLAEALKTAKLNQYASRAGQPLVSGSRIYPVEILVPPMPLQLQFAKQIEDLDVLLAQARRSGQSLDSLNSAMLYRVFSGELTAKWREARMKELLREMEEQAMELGPVE